MSLSAALPVFTASVVTETNSFSPFPTGLETWKEGGLIRRDASLVDPEGGGAALRCFRELIEADGRPVIESLSAFAQPAGPTVGTVYQMLKGQLLEDLRAAGPVAFILLALHGAMIADDCDDCEGDIIGAVRDIVGADVPIGVVLDPHCHLTEKMVAGADALVFMKEYPHTDFRARAGELYSICNRTSRGEVRPVSAVFDCRMVGFYPTTFGPMEELVRLFEETEQEAGILSVSLVHGFPWGDHPDVGTRLLVVADGDGEKARATAERLGLAVYARRDALLPSMPKVEVAIHQAETLEGLVVLADTADNTGGGAPGDTTGLLQAMLAADIGPSVFGLIYDPQAVRICDEAGTGVELRLRLGGKLGATSGDPFDVTARVMAVRKDHHQTLGGTRYQFGASAWVRIGTIDVAICSLRNQVVAPDAFTGLGIELEGKHVVGLKSSEHFRAGFKDLAAHIIPVATSGALQMDFATIAYERKRDLRYHPRVADPLGPN
jgi:microcystin degradation protein MlrC